jgi:4-amino-4-deoxy-L-arabinose transferase-like glycosyltransferase
MRLPAPTANRLLPLLAAFVMVQSLYNQTLPLSGDEAYYWVWSHHLQAGYHDHPPAIALLIAFCTRLWGDSVVAVRLAASLAMAITVFIQVRLAARIAGDRAGWLALFLCLALPAFEMGFTLATPDDPLVMFWSGGLLFALPALTEDGKWRDFIGMGLCCGLAMASKYTGVLLPLSLTIFVAIHQPRQLLSARLWAAGGVALLAFSPVLWWNANNGFESFLFQYRHGSGEANPFNIKDLGQYLGGQALVLSPVLAALLIYLAARWKIWRQDAQQSLLMVCFLAPFALFTEKALFAKIQLNWALPAYLSALPLLAGFMAEHKRRWILIAAGLIPAVALTFALKWPALVGLTGKYNPHNRLYGPDAAAREIERLRAPGDVIMADHLQRASLLTFLLQGHPRAYIPTPSRFSEYTRWDQDVDFSKLHGLYLSQDDRTEDLGKSFSQVELVEKMHSYRKNGREQTYFIFRVGN